jgi:F5/8 type C domain
MTELSKSGEPAPETTESTAAAPAETTKRPIGKLAKLAFALLYIVFLILVVVGLLAGIEYYAYLKVKDSSLGLAYKGRSLDNARRSTQKVAPLYGYEPTPGFAAVRNLSLGNSPEFINAESFKDFKDVPMRKPAGEYRVIVTGGSVIYGRGPVPPADQITDHYEITFRWTIPHIMEELLNADPQIREKVRGKRIRVINAGVPGYVYENELMRYLAKLRLFNPDLVVSLDGANEPPAVARPLKDWNYFTQGQYYDVVSQVMSFGPKGLLNYFTLWLKRNTYFFTWLAMKKDQNPGILDESGAFVPYPQDPTPEMMKYLHRNIAQVADVMAFYHKALETDGVPHVFALQPLSCDSKKQRMPIERQIEKVSPMVKLGFYYAAPTYELLIKKIEERGKETGINVADFTKIYDNVHAWVFTDWCHLTDGANYVMAKKLVDRVKTDVFKIPLQPDDKIQDPADSYFVDYAKEATVLVNGKAVDRGLHILKGYPGRSVLEVPQDKSKPESVVLDLGSTKPISRLRIVWGDKKSVPESWGMEISQDGTVWKKWFSIDKTNTDGYDRWPGFEYYAPQESQARFVRYTPTSKDGGAIRLRQLSLFK